MCVRGFVQNNNHKHNQLIWKITPKMSLCDFKILEISAHIATDIFN